MTHLKSEQSKNYLLLLLVAAANAATFIALSS